MKKKWVISIVILVLLVFLIIYLTKWSLKTYRNEEYGFEFKYPEFDKNNVKNEIYEVQKDSDGLIVMIAPNYGMDVYSTIFSVSYKPISYEKEIQSIIDSYKNSSYDTLINVNDIKISELQAKKIETKVIDNQSGYVASESVEYCVNGPKNNNSIFILEGDERILDILNTFRFVS